MRIGLDLTGVGDPDRRLGLAVEADQLGLWAVLLTGPSGTETVEAAIVATATSSIHLAVLLDGRGDHPLTLAEEVSVLDHLSSRRALVVLDGTEETREHLSALLAGQIVGGVALSPPPAQTSVPVWDAERVSRVELTGDLAIDVPVIDHHRDRGCTHLFVAWPGPIPTLARHLVTRAAGPDFPSIVADLADRIEPPPVTG